MSDIIIREVTKDIWTFSRPFSRFHLFPVGGRSTAIKLKSGGVWVLASTPLTADTKSKLDEIGPVRYICGPDSVHWLFLGDFKKAYPDAKLYSVEEAVKNKVDKSLKFDGVWGGTNGPDKFEDDITACYFSGFKNKDVAFFHSPSKTLLTADLIFNLPGTEQESLPTLPSCVVFIYFFFQYSKIGLSKLPGASTFRPYTWFHQQYVRSMGVDKEAMKRDAKTVADWDFNRIIPCHGDVIETDGNKAWRHAFAAFLN